MNEIATFLNQPIGYNIFETTLCVAVIAYTVLVIKLALEDE